MPGVAAGLAVLAGIAGSDAICARRLGAIHRGEDHRGAAALLEDSRDHQRRTRSAYGRFSQASDLSTRGGDLATEASSIVLYSRAVRDYLPYALTKRIIRVLWVRRSRSGSSVHTLRSV